MGFLDKKNITIGKDEFGGAFSKKMSAAELRNYCGTLLDESHSSKDEYTTHLPAAIDKIRTLVMDNLILIQSDPEFNKVFSDTTRYSGSVLVGLARMANERNDAKSLGQINDLLGLIGAEKVPMTIDSVAVGAMHNKNKAPRNLLPVSEGRCC